MPRILVQAVAGVALETEIVQRHRSLFSVFEEMGFSFCIRIKGCVRRIIIISIGNNVEDGCVWCHS